MQAISRANRVFADKKSGMIVDYYGILRRLKQALAIYGSGTGGGIQEGDMPLRQVDELERLLKQNLELIQNYFQDKNIDPHKILLARGFEQLRQIGQAVETVLENDQSRILFFSLLKVVVDSYTDLLPDPRANKYRLLVSLYVHIGETIASDIPEVDISDIENRIQDLVDRSIAVKPYGARKPIRLSPTEINQQQNEYGVLLDGAEPFIQLLKAAVQGSGFITTLSNKDGYVLGVWGDQEILNMAQDNNYLPGCRRTEDEVGTNAIGLALSLRKPVQVTGPEHYNINHHLWTCCHRFFQLYLAVCNNNVTLTCPPKIGPVSMLE